MSQRLSRRRRWAYLVTGWLLVVWGFVSYPLPLYPSTATIVIGLLMIAQVQPWARRVIVVARRRVRPFNRLYLTGHRRLRPRRVQDEVARAPAV